MQARYHSTRLPGKMLLDLGGQTLIARGWRLACETFGAAHVVVAIPAGDEAGPLGDELRRLGAAVFAWDGPEADVLGRFHACAHQYRTDPASVIARITPDDFPIDVTRERFTLAWLDRRQGEMTEPVAREHIGLLLFPRLEINTPADYAVAQQRIANEE